MKITMEEPFEQLQYNIPTDCPDSEEEAANQLDEIVGGSLVAPVSHGIMAGMLLCHGLAVRSGWWNDLATGEWKDRNDGEMIALMHSELSEALEGIRKGAQDDHLPHRKSVEVELADCLIRIFDYAGARRLDLAGALIEKLAYNQQRADHKAANRAADGGKKF